MRDKDLLDTDMSSKHFVCLQDMPSRRLQEMSSKRLQGLSRRHLGDVFSVTIFRFRRRFQDVFARSLQDVLEDEKLLHCRRVKHVSKTSRLEDQKMLAEKEL